MASKCLIFKLNPDEYKKLSNFPITYGTASTKFGKCFLALNGDNVCFLSFLDGTAQGVGDLNVAFPKATLTEDNELISSKAKDLFDNDSKEDIKVLLKGTDFETKVWRELVNLKKGTTASYADVAKAIGNPKAIRAVAKAVSKNNVSYLVPCHRVISKSGGLSKYRWGKERKLQMLKDEKAI